MPTELRRYKILQCICILCAAGLTIIICSRYSIANRAWLAAAGFAFFALVTELLAVNLADESLAEITPSSPIYWAAACVLGPAATIVVCVASSLSADVGTLIAFLLVRRRASHSGFSADGGHADESSAETTDDNESVLWRVLTKIGQPWHHKSKIGVLGALRSGTAYLAILILITGLAAMFYQRVGGEFLIDGMPKAPLTQFVLPFLGLCAIAIGVDVMQYVIAMVVYDPLPGSKGLRGVLLRMHLELIQTALPLMRAQVFLVVVSLMLAYLYVRVGAWAFVLTSLPVVALRDFYSHWVREQSAYLDTITTLATYMQHYHPYTRGHLKRVAELSERLARELRLPAESIRHISHAGLLHDIGKIGVSEVILDKTSKLEPEEWEKIKSHPVAGAEIISHLDFLEGIVDWIRYHHKWHDGRGYPETNGAGMIPVEAAIIAVVDSFDAMTDDRELSLDWACDSCGYKPEDGGRPEACPECGATKGRTYRAPKSLDQAIDELRRGSGSQFHPAVVKAFLAMLDRDGVHLDAR